MSKTVAMILAGGRVDELGVLTFYRPKSTVPFGSLYRFIDFPLSNLMFSGIHRVGILSQYRSSSLVEHIGTGASWDMTGRHRGITILPPFKGLHASDWYKGTADAVYQNLDFLSAQMPDHVLIISGDHVYSMDYNDLIRFHHDMNADVSAAFVNVPVTGSSRFGLGKIADDDPRGGRLIEYVEKPERPISSWASMTIYLFNFEILKEALEDNVLSDSHEFGRDIFPVLLSTCRVYGYKFHGYWAYCRTVEEYWQKKFRRILKNGGFASEWVAGFFRNRLKINEPWVIPDGHSSHVSDSKRIRIQYSIDRPLGSKPALNQMESTDSSGGVLEICIEKGSNLSWQRPCFLYSANRDMGNKWL